MNNFSSQVKKELSELNNLANKDNVKAEIKGYLLTIDGNVFSTSSKYNINRFAKLLSNLYINDYKISMKGNNFQISVKKNSIDEYRNYVIESNNSEQLRSLIRGAFLGSGTITDPKNMYHLEIIFENEENANYINEVLVNFEVKCI